MHVALATFAHPELAGPDRAGLTARYRPGSEPEDAFVLSTCLRTEVVVHGSTQRLTEVAEQVFGDAAVLDMAVIRSREDAVHHLFRVAAGLESAIVGEPEVLAQFRQSLAGAKADRGLDGLLVKLLETAVSTGRQARQVLGSSPHDSMGAVAAQAAGAADRVAVLGAGVMARAVVAALRGLPAPPEVTVLVRSPENVTLPGVDIWPFDRAADAIVDFPAVVSATSASTRLLDDLEFGAALARRSSPLTLVDLAMPPDFSPPPGASISYIDIDGLAAMARRRPRSTEADELVAAEAADRHRRLADHAAVGPLVGSLVRAADDVVADVVARFAGRLEADGDREVLAQAAQTVARTLLARPINHIRSPGRSDDSVEALAEAFGVETAT